MNFDWNTTLLVGFSTIAGVGALTYALPSLIGWWKGDRYLLSMDGAKAHESNVAMPAVLPPHNGWYERNSGNEIARVGSYKSQSLVPSEVKILRYKVGGVLVQSTGPQIVGNHIFSPAWLLAKLGKDHKGVNKASILTRSGRVVTVDLAKGEYIEVGPTDVKIEQEAPDKTLEFAKFFGQSY